LAGAVLLADGHQAGHLVFGEDHLLATERGERQVGDAEVATGSEAGGHGWVLLEMGSSERDRPSGRRDEPGPPGTDRVSSRGSRRYRKSPTTSRRSRQERTTA